jgi:hypothetical protein
MKSVEVRSNINIQPSGESSEHFPESRAQMLQLRNRKKDEAFDRIQINNQSTLRPQQYSERFLINRRQREETGLMRVAE